MIKEILLRARKRRHRTLVVLCITFVVAVTVCGLTGATILSPLDFIRWAKPGLISLRLSRIVLGLVVGASLSVAGVIFQAILRNPLAEPYVLGISSGAGLGAVLSLVAGWCGSLYGISCLPLTAFLGALLTMVLVYNLARIGNKIPVQSLLLSGVIVGAVFSSITMFLVSVSQAPGLHGCMWWLLGNLQIFDRELLVTVTGISLVGISVSIFFSRELNAIVIGEEEAIHLGIDVELVKRILFVVASLITGAVVSACGLIGFVGLIVPHALRLVVGSDHRILLPAVALSGGIFLTLCDLIARTAMAPDEIPIGVITALIGGPFFIVLLRRKRKISFR